MHNKNLNKSIYMYIGKKIKNKYIQQKLGQGLINNLRRAVPIIVMTLKSFQNEVKKNPNSQTLTKKYT